jgi:hypothetical protein
MRARIKPQLPKNILSQGNDFGAVAGVAKQGMPANLPGNILPAVITDEDFRTH